MLIDYARARDDWLSTMIVLRKMIFILSERRQHCASCVDWLTWIRSASATYPFRGLSRCAMPRLFTKDYIYNDARSYAPGHIYHAPRFHLMIRCCRLMRAIIDLFYRHAIIDAAVTPLRGRRRERYMMMMIHDKACKKDRGGRWCVCQFRPFEKAKRQHL